MYICNNGNNLIYLNRSLPQCELSFFKIYLILFDREFLIFLRYFAIECNFHAYVFTI